MLAMPNAPHFFTLLFRLGCMLQVEHFWQLRSQWSAKDMLRHHFQSLM